MYREEDVDVEDIDLDEITPEEIEKMLQEADKMEVHLAIAVFNEKAPRLDLSGIKQIILELEKIINEKAAFCKTFAHTGAHKKRG